MFLFVNSRYVRDKVVVQALKSGYGTLLPAGDSPYAILNIDVPPSELDVNVHPMKAEVRFSNSGEVFGAVSRAVKLTLAQNPHVARAVQESLGGLPLPAAGGPDSGTNGPQPWPAGGPVPRVFGAPLSPQPSWGQSSLPLGPKAEPQVSSLTEDQRSRLVMIDERWMGYSPQETQDSIPVADPSRADRFTWDEGDLVFAPQAPGGPSQGVTQRPLVDPSRSPQPGWSHEESLQAGSTGTAATSDAMRPRPISGMGLGAMRYLGQFANCFLLGQLGNRLVVVDQHAAHERVLFEQLRADWSKRKVVSQGSLTPHLLEVEPRILASALAKQELLEALGFRVEVFGNRKLAIHSAPALFRGRSPVRTLFTLLEELPENTDLNQTDLFHKPLSTVACHAAVRAGDPMEREEVRQLLQLMDTVDLAAFCPHGRPVVVFLEEADVAKWFKRT